MALQEGVEYIHRSKVISLRKYFEGAEGAQESFYYISRLVKTAVFPQTPEMQNAAIEKLGDFCEGHVHVVFQERKGRWKPFRKTYIRMHEDDRYFFVDDFEFPDGHEPKVAQEG